MSYPDIGEKKLKILKDAAKVFARRGFHRSKMEEIAQEADMGKGTVYEYFSGKEQLFFELIRIGREYYRESLTKEIENEASLYDKLKMMAYLHLKFIQEHKDLGRVMMQEFLQLNSEMHNYFCTAKEQEIGLFSKVFEDGMAQKVFRPMDSRFVAQIFHGAVHAMGVPMIFWGEEPDLHQLADQIVEVFLNGIAK